MSMLRRLFVAVAIVVVCSPLAGCCYCWCGDNPTQPNFFVDTVAQAARAEVPAPAPVSTPVVTARY